MPRLSLVKLVWLQPYCPFLSHRQSLFGPLRLLLKLLCCNEDLVLFVDKTYSLEIRLHNDHLHHPLGLASKSSLCSQTGQRKRVMWFRLPTLWLSSEHSDSQLLTPRRYCHRQLNYPPPPFTDLRGTNKLHSKLDNSLSIEKTSLSHRVAGINCLLQFVGQSFRKCRIVDKRKARLVRKIFKCLAIIQ